MEVPAAQQRVWQSPFVHCASEEQTAPVARSEQSPAMTEYGDTHEVQAPAASQALQWVDFPEAQHLLWQSPSVHWESAEQSVPAGARHLPADAVYPELHAVHTPEASQAEQKDEVPAAQQRVWQSPDVHSLLAEHAAPELRSEQSPPTTLYGLLQAVQAPDASHVVHSIDLPAEQQKLWQSPSVHSLWDVHAVPAGARQLPELAV